MKKFQKKIVAFTLAELAVILMIIAVIATISIKLSTSKTSYVTKFMYYSTYNNLKTVVAELIGEGCPLTSTSCREAKTLPVFGYVGDGSGFCEKLADTMNTIGTPLCNPATTTIANGTTDFSAAIPNFKTTNGAIYYNFGTDPIFAEGAYPANYNSTPEDDNYMVYVDIDGPKGKSILNQDVMKFKIKRSGLVLPNKTSSGANDTNYLSTSIRYKNGGATKYLKRGVSYRESECTAGKITDVTFCEPFVQDNVNCPVANNTCEVIINKPGF